MAPRSDRAETQARSPSGVGLGLRAPIARELCERRPGEVQWVEIHPENYVGRGGRFAEWLNDAAAQWPVITHGLTLGVGAVEPFEEKYLRELRAFLHDLRVPWHSEHLCWTGV